MIGIFTTRARLPWLVATSFLLLGLGLLVQFG
ncbi:MAG: hypothetical protein JWN66_3590 [Sphingomonas bacterium]|jgi:hypothetical protein|nr:hypothetical protein [Sphingomonas bacterium]